MCHRRTRERSQEQVSDRSVDDSTEDESVGAPGDSGGVVRTPVRALKQAVVAIVS
jgi:hypothetical protein